MRRGARSNSSGGMSLSIEDMESGGVSSSNHSTGSMSPSTSAMNMSSPSEFMGSGAYSGDKGNRRSKSTLSSLFQFSSSLSSEDSLKKYVGILFAVIFIFSMILSLEYRILLLVFGSCGFGAIASLWLSQNVLSCDDGTPEMRSVSDPIREGADGFLRVQYSVRIYCLCKRVSFL